jgi:hypothetical protein
MMAMRKGPVLVEWRMGVGVGAGADAAGALNQMRERREMRRRICRGEGRSENAVSIGEPVGEHSYQRFRRQAGDRPPHGCGSYERNCNEHSKAACSSTRSV